jgi:hypothetical protein
MGPSNTKLFTSFFKIMLNLTLNNQKSGYYPLVTLMVQKTIKVKIDNPSKGTPLPDKNV